MTATCEPNKCGTCRMCCNLLGVPELAKPHGTMCRHATSTGCGIYADRPSTCRSYACLWLQSQSQPSSLPVAARPDNLGVIFDQLSEREDTVVARLRPHELAKLDSPPAKLLISIILKTFRYIVVSCGSRREVLTREMGDLNETFTDGHGEFVAKVKLVP